jgi:hypothetical protein
MMTSEGNIQFSNFWPEFDEENNFILEALIGQEVFSPIEVTSVFANSSRSLLREISFRMRSAPKNRYSDITPRRVWFTAENIRPPVGKQFDSFVSFDQDTYGGVNFYFPLLYAELLLREKQWTKRRGLDFDKNELLRPRQSPRTKQKFVCAFISNPEPVRMRAIDELRKYGEVDVYGPHFVNTRLSKYEIAKEYKFMLCFENDLYPGYVTEKLLDAYTCETVPLYRGLFGHEEHVNQKALINAANFESLGSFCDYVGKLSGLEYEETFREPLLKTLPTLEPLIAALTGKPSRRLEK